MRSVYAFGIMFFGLAAGPVFAQDDQAAKSSPASGALEVISSDGVFTVTLGKSKDITDRKILLSFPQHSWNRPESFEQGQAYLTINGDRACTNSCETGARIDLKTKSDKLGDREDCFLDVVEITSPRGGKPTVVLRLSCS